MITPYTLNASLCMVSFNVASDPIVGLFTKQRSIANNASSTTTIQNASNNNAQFTYLIYIILAIVIILVILAILIISKSRPKRNKR